MNATATKTENDRPAPALGNEGNGATVVSTVLEKENKKVSPVIDSDAMNDALLAVRNPAMALIKIRGLTADIRTMMRNNADRTEIACALNKIVALTGKVA
jgi:hypothetical protein